MSKNDAEKKTPGPKRLVVEIAPAVRTMLDGYIAAYNEKPERASPPYKYTDVINQALDEFLTNNNH
jgi:hypothetical protein